VRGFLAPPKVVALVVSTLLAAAASATVVEWTVRDQSANALVWLALIGLPLGLLRGWIGIPLGLVGFYTAVMTRVFLQQGPPWIESETSRALDHLIMAAAMTPWAGLLATGALVGALIRRWVREPTSSSP